ncbi:uncharacterized protein LACBIDRAFT_312316 [Laccaria bicolor S238N-H82]|uniref:Predicted protein n=1 Tax=Laccaria bicolor (strain S238N-H82 / ATCC MYA-4686) TaxID=486041 RepID=B0DVY2_LACBS|nr:uncharacterized protein LACBIDRAFT_312316 [Laccaria bicolor S238N-H82]EDR01216.1 predicted protein [Laccaria bicolor S238N-H82]|eukprot:XP_001888092.1 predicted protein [Laccaria bicolor S238N-H82]
MAHDFLFPPPNYPKTYSEELYSPLNTLNHGFSNTDFSRTMTRSNLSHRAPTTSSNSYNHTSGSQNAYQAAEVILKSATHFMLMAAHNQAHSDLYKEYMCSKYQLEAQMKLVTELKEELREARNLTKCSCHNGFANDRAPITPSIKIPEAPPPAK